MLVYLSSQHDVCGSLDSINKGLPASVEVVELGLGDRVVDVDGGNLQLALLEHAVQVVDTSCGLLTHTLKISKREQSINNTKDANIPQNTNLHRLHKNK